MGSEYSYKLLEQTNLAEEIKRGLPDVPRLLVDEDLDPGQQWPARAFRF